jgi:hypothetical protein
MNRSAPAHPHKVIACREYDIIVPFLCHRCGNCCRKYEPIIELELLPEIARSLGEPIDVIQNRLGADSLSHGRRASDGLLLPASPAFWMHHL